jgi:hypothetical protein
MNKLVTIKYSTIALMALISVGHATASNDYSLDPLVLKCIRVGMNYAEAQQSVIKLYNDGKIGENELRDLAQKDVNKLFMYACTMQNLELATSLVKPSEVQLSADADSIRVGLSTVLEYENLKLLQIILNSCQEALGNDEYEVGIALDSVVRSRNTKITEFLLNLPKDQLQPSQYNLNLSFFAAVQKGYLDIATLFLTRGEGRLRPEPYWLLTSYQEAKARKYDEIVSILGPLISEGK